MKKRILTLEKRYKTVFAMRAAEQCNCRFAAPTTYHTVAELKGILKIRCPVHGMRFHASIMWASLDVPLAVADQDCCSCRSDVWRNYRLGKREYPTLEEQASYREEWWKELNVALTPAGEKAALHEIASADQLIKAFEKARGETHGHKL